MKLSNRIKFAVIIAVCAVLIAAVSSIAIMRMPTPAIRYILKAVITTNTTTAFTDEPILFDASNSTGDIIEYTWDFGYGVTTDGKIVNQSFPRSAVLNNYYTGCLCGVSIASGYLFNRAGVDRMTSKKNRRDEVVIVIKMGGI